MEKPHGAAVAKTKGMRRQKEGEWYIPTVPTAQEVLDKAFHKATKVTVEDRSVLHRARRTAMARVESVAGTIDAVLKRTVTSFPSLDNLHPFYREVLDLAVDLEELHRSLATVDWCRKQVREVARKAVRQIARTRKRDYVELKRRELYGRVSSLLERVAKDLERLQDARAVLRSMPAIDPKLPTAVVAGSPNVGKSALVAKLSSGEPEVSSYPFTTKAVTVGHFFDKGRPYQVVDTPGLLDRPTEERNPIERRAMAAVAYLPHVIVFLVDPTGHSGMEVETQEALLGDIREQFPEADVLVVETKSDLGGREDLGNLKVSSVSGEGVKELREELIKRLPRPEIEWVVREG
jgi:nucleolar GTP-binding protein